MYKCKVCNNISYLFIKSLRDDRYGYPGVYSVYRCKTCGFCETYPKIKHSQISNLYTKYYPRKDFDIKTIKKTKEEFEWNLIARFTVWWMGRGNVCHYQINRGEKVLDVGCGDGTSLIEIEKMGGIAYGTEQDKNVLRISKELKLRIRLGDLDKYPQKEKYDVICASQVIEHQEDVNKFLFEINKRLKREGRIILSFPNVDSIFRRIFGKKWINWHVPYHMSFFTKNSLELASSNNSLKIVKWATITPTMWSVFQILNQFSSDKNKRGNIMWQSIEKMSMKIRLIKAIYGLFEKFANIFISPINRIVDLLGYGDSVIVILKPSK